MKRILLLTSILFILSIGFLKADQFAVNPQAYLYKNFADKLLVAGKKSEAIVAYQWASFLDPSYGNAHYNRAIALNEMARFADARDALESYLKLCPKDSEALYNKGVLSIYLQDFEAAENAFLLALNRCKDPQFARSISKALSFLVRYQDRLALYDQPSQKKLHKQLLTFAR